MFRIQNQFKTFSILKLSREQKCPSALISWFREISSVRGWASRQAECAHDALSVCCRRQIRPSARQHSITDETTGSSNCLQQSIQYQRVADCTRLLAECRLVPLVGKALGASPSGLLLTWRVSRICKQYPLNYCYFMRLDEDVYQCVKSDARCAWGLYGQSITANVMMLTSHSRLC